MAGPLGLVIAIDGVGGAGKSTVARGVARALGYRHLDTGAMYRAVAWAARHRGVTAAEGETLARLLQDLCLDLEPEAEGGRVRVDGEDVTAAIRDPEISRVVGSYADRPEVRRALVARQQALGVAGGVVAEGRDVTIVVFPDADLKVFMVADLDERARRRHRELAARGIDLPLERVQTDIERRDRQDSERDYGGDDARGTVTVDTTGLSIDAAVDRIVFLARERGA